MTNRTGESVVRGALIRLAAVGLATVVAACSGERPSDRSPSEQQVQLSVPSPCASPMAAAGELSTACFGVQLLAAVSGEGDSNALISPMGVGAVLDMAAQGATATVRTAIREMLGAGSTNVESGDRDTQSAYGLAAVLTAADQDAGVELHAVNAAFANRHLDIYPAYSAMLEARFDAPVQRLNFADSAAVETINAWAAQATGGAVPRLLASLEPDDALVLANALHFEGDWAEPFDPAQTAPLPFHLASGDAVHVPTMQADDLPARYREDAGFQAVLLTYGNGAFALAVVLPGPGMAPADAMHKLTADSSWLGGAGFLPARGSLALPRVTLESKASLLPVLRELGLAAALEDERAFAGIAAPAPLLSRVAQSTRLVLDEEGTEAVATTAAVMSTRSAIMDEDWFDMRVDRPFALAVRHRGTGALLFTAWVANPGRSQ